MHLLNAINVVCVLITNQGETSNEFKNVSPSIGNCFLLRCRDLIFKSTNDENIRTLAQMDLDDADQMDAHNREREKIINLIITICYLYDQRNTANIKLTAKQLIPLINILFDRYQTLQAKMNDLGNPYEEDCEDEEEYELCQKMCSLYAEQIYTFISREMSDFKKDPTDHNGSTLQSLVAKFRTDIIPTLTEAFLVSKCENLGF